MEGSAVGGVGVKSVRDEIFADGRKGLRRAAAALLACAGVVLLLGGCGSNAISGVTINVVSSTGTLTMDESQPAAVPPAVSKLNLTATVGNDTSNKGVIWESSTHPLTGTGCAGEGTATGQCGTLTNATPFSVTYTAPSNLAAAITVTVTVQSNAEPSVTSTVTINVAIPPTFVTTAAGAGTTGTGCSQTNIPPCVLPNGANGVPYSQSIAITGGVAPYTFAITSGSLPACLKLNQILTSTSTSTTATINQTPCGSRTGTTTSNFTVTVTDSGGAPPISLAFQITVTAPPALSIVNAPLAPGIVDGVYNGGITSIGGVAPLSWSLVTPAAGSVPAGGIPGLPPGLALNTSTGQITGIPTPQAVTYPATYYFNVQVQDSALPTPGQIVPTLPAPFFAITIQAPQPLSITTQGPTLAGGSTATGYSTTLQATGGVPAQPLTGLPAYTWTVIQGQLPPGLTLHSQANGTGLISGTPTVVSNSTFTVQVSDSKVDPISGAPTPDTATATFTIPIVAGGANNTLFKGEYAFSFNGFDTDGSVIAIGEITSDGNGNITAGTQDSNRVSGVAAAPATITGTYAMDPSGDGRGTMEWTITLGQNNPLIEDFNFVMDGSGNIRFFANYATTTQTDAKHTHGEGILKPVSGSSFATANFSGNYAFEFPGFDLSKKPAALAGVIHADGASGLTSGIGDFNDGGTYNAQFPIGGDYSIVSGNRGTAEMTFALGNAPQTTLNFVFYFVSSSDLYFLEADVSPTAGTLLPTNYRLAGEMVLQQPTTVFNSTALQGVSVASGTGVNSGGNASVYAGLLTAPACDGHTAITLTADENNGGTIAQPSFTGTCTITTNGRAAFALTGVGSPAPAPAPRVSVAYLTGPGQGFLLGTDAAATTGLLERQTGGPFALSSLTGAYTLGALRPADASVKNVLGQATADGLGDITGMVDEMDPTGASAPNLLKSLTAAISGLTSGGRGIFTLTGTVPPGFPASSVLYIVSPGDFRLVSSSSADTHPQLMFFDH